MREQLEILKSWRIDSTWSLFLDRDGIINKKIENSYVTRWEEFEFLPDLIPALRILGTIFSKMFIVTNQRGIGKGLMTEQDLYKIHDNMLSILEQHEIHIKKIYYCPHDYEKESCNCRKPDIGMGLAAKKDFPEIDFSRSVMVGDSLSDIEFGERLGMKMCYIGNEYMIEREGLVVFYSLRDLALCIKTAIWPYHNL